MPAVGRNDPCPCGSGRKFKRCCGEAVPERDANEIALEWQALDQLLVNRILAFGRSTHAKAYQAALSRMPCQVSLDPSYEQIIPPFIAYHGLLDGENLLELFLARHASRLDPREAAWLEANRGGVFSVWEVEHVDRGRGMRMRDLLSGEVRDVTERMGSQGLEVRLALCGRMVSMDGLTLMVGSHPRPLKPSQADVVVLDFRKFLAGWAGRAPAPESRDSGALALLGRWHATVMALDARPLPTLQNTDGDPLVQTEDTFSILRGARGAVAAAVAGIEGMENRELEGHRPGDAKVTSFRWARLDPPSNKVSLGKTSLGTLEIDDAQLTAITNSERRADALRKRIERACGVDLVHRDRSRLDMQDAMASRMGASRGGRTQRDPEPGIPPEIGDPIIRAAKQHHYGSWCDVPIPALDGLTPRQAVTRPAVAPRLVALLKDLDLMEARETPGRRFDTAALWENLGLRRP